MNFDSMMIFEQMDRLQEFGAMAIDNDMKQVKRGAKICFNDVFCFGWANCTSNF